METPQNIYSSCGIILAEATLMDIDNYHGRQLKGNLKMFELNRLLINEVAPVSIDILPIMDPIENWTNLREVSVGAMFVWDMSDFNDSSKRNISINQLQGKTAFSEKSIIHINTSLYLNKSKMIMDDDKYSESILFLKSNISISKNDIEKYKKYRLINDYCVIGDILYRKDEKGKKNLKVVNYSMIFGIVKNIHCNYGHIGIVKTFKAVQDEYYGITQSHISMILKECSICATSVISKSACPLKPIISTKVFERIQIDLVDMRSTPDTISCPGKSFNWILHLKDHFSKFSSFYALEKKDSVGVACKLGEWFGMFGPPEIIQCDNGNEFKGI